MKLLMLSMHAVYLMIIVVLLVVIDKGLPVETFKNVIDNTPTRCIISKYKPTEFESAVKRTE